MMLMKTNSEIVEGLLGKSRRFVASWRRLAACVLALTAMSTSPALSVSQDCNGDANCVCGPETGPVFQSGASTCVISCQAYVLDIVVGCCTISGCTPAKNCTARVVIETDSPVGCAIVANGQGAPVYYSGGGTKKFVLRFDQPCGSPPIPFYVSAPLNTPPHGQVIVCGRTVQCMMCPG